MTRLIERRALLAAGVAAVAAPAVVRAQAWPSRPIRLVIPYPPGGSVDIMSRLWGERLAAGLPATVTPDNRPGAGGNIGMDIVAKAPADGYTIGCSGASTHGINPTLYGARLPFDSIRDFAPVARIVTIPNLLVVHPDLPARTVPELIALLKANPGKYAFASAGAGTSIHLSGEFFKFLTGVDMLHVPYKGSAPALQDLLAGRTQLMFDNMPSALPHAKAGKLRALGVTTPQRAPAEPDIPAIGEFVPGYDAGTYSGIWAPAGTPPDIVKRMADVLVAAGNDPALKARLISMGAIPAPLAGPGLAQYIAETIARWAPVVKASGATVE